MSIRVAINGFGRMGRLVLRAGWGTPGIEFVHINEIRGGPECAAHLLEFDTVQGRWDNRIGFTEESVSIDGKTLGFTEVSQPGDLDWAALDVDMVLECTGKFKTTEALAPYFQRGVKKVIVAAPVKTEGALNLVYGINHDLYDPDEHHLLTAASCTTNCLAPVVKVVHENIGVVRGSMTTIHDVTNTQVMVDAPHKDLRRARSGLNALIPTTTGSATAITITNVSANSVANTLEMNRSIAAFPYRRPGPTSCFSALGRICAHSMVKVGPKSKLSFDNSAFQLRQV